MEHRRREGRLLFPVKTGAIRCNCSIRRGITGEGRSKDVGGRDAWKYRSFIRASPTLSAETTKPRS